MDLNLIIIMALLLVAFIALNSWSKKSQKKRQDEHDRLMKEQLVPGAWVHTRVGFFGRFVDLDGDVLILETPSGEETYWNKAVLVSVGDLPFAGEDGDAETELPAVEATDDVDDVEVEEIDAVTETSVPDDARELTGDDSSDDDGDTKN